MELNNQEHGALYIALGTVMISQDVDAENALDAFQDELVRIMASQGIDRLRARTILNEANTGFDLTNVDSTFDPVIADKGELDYREDTEGAQEVTLEEDDEDELPAPKRKKRHTVNREVATDSLNKAYGDPTRASAIAQCLNLTCSFATSDDGLELEDMEEAVRLTLDLNELSFEDIAKRIVDEVVPSE